jgi:hypothetical protein
MIECRTCSFSVAQTMRHALTTNCCPACGSALLGEVHQSRLRIFRQKLLGQSFAEKLGQDDIFDIALFMLVEFFPPTSDAALPDLSADPKGDDSSDEASTEGDASRDQKETYESIREKVRDEMTKDVSSLGREALDEDLKVQRLKRLAKESPIPSRTTVRRVGS